MTDEDQVNEARAELELSRLQRIREKATAEVLTAKRQRDEDRERRIADATKEIDADIDATWKQHLQSLFKTATTAIHNHEDALIAFRSSGLAGTPLPGTKMIEWTNYHYDGFGRMRSRKTIPWEPTGRTGRIEVITADAEHGKVKYAKASVGDVVIRLHVKGGKPGKQYAVQSFNSDIFFGWYPEGVHPDSVPRQVRPTVIV